MFDWWMKKCVRNYEWTTMIVFVNDLESSVGKSTFWITFGISRNVETQVNQIEMNFKHQVKIIQKISHNFLTPNI